MYDEYVPAVAQRLRDAADDDEAVERVSEYLTHVESDWMGVFTAKRGRTNRDLAEALVAWHERSFEWRGRQPPPGA